MTIQDPHDPRQFRRYVQVAPDGTVLATSEIAVEHGPPAVQDTRAFVDVTDEPMQDWSAVNVLTETSAIRATVATALSAQAEVLVVRAEAAQAAADAAKDVTPTV